MTSPDTEVIPLLVTMGYPGDGSLELRFPAEYAEEILALLDEHQLSHGTVLEFSEGVDLWIEAVRVIGGGGGLVALATIIKAFLRRHDGKRFKLERDGAVFEASGYSEKDVERILKDVVDQQADRDAEWDRVLGTQDE